MRPQCHNRPSREPGYWRHGVGGDGEPYKCWVSSQWSEDRCATWDGVGIGQNGERYPEAHGWDCSVCRWLPENIA